MRKSPVYKNTNPQDLAAQRRLNQQSTDWVLDNPRNPSHTKPLPTNRSDHKLLATVFFYMLATQFVVDAQQEISSRSIFRLPRSPNGPKGNSRQNNNSTGAPSTSDIVPPDGKAAKNGDVSSPPKTIPLQHSGLSVHDFKSASASNLATAKNRLPRFARSADTVGETLGGGLDDGELSSISLEEILPDNDYSIIENAHAYMQMPAEYADEQLKKQGVDPAAFDTVTAYVGSGSDIPDREESQLTDTNRNLYMRGHKTPAMGDIEPFESSYDEKIDKYIESARSSTEKGFIKGFSHYNIDPDTEVTLYKIDASDKYEHQLHKMRQFTGTFGRGPNTLTSPFTQIIKVEQGSKERYFALMINNKRAAVTPIQVEKLGEWLKANRLSNFGDHTTLSDSETHYEIKATKSGITAANAAAEASRMTEETLSVSESILHEMDSIEELGEMAKSVAYPLYDTLQAAKRGKYVQAVVYLGLELVFTSTGTSVAIKVIRKGAKALHKLRRTNKLISKTEKIKKATHSAGDASTLKKNKHGHGHRTHEVEANAAHNAPAETLVRLPETFLTPTPDEQTLITKIKRLIDTDDTSQKYIAHPKEKCVVATQRVLDLLEKEGYTNVEVRAFMKWSKLDAAMDNDIQNHFGALLKVTGLRPVYIDTTSRQFGVPGPIIDLSENSLKTLHDTFSGVVKFQDFPTLRSATSRFHTWVHGAPRDFEADNILRAPKQYFAPAPPPRKQGPKRRRKKYRIRRRHHRHKN